MKIVVQRVHRAAVRVADTTAGEISTGLVLFVGVSADDTEEVLPHLARKIIEMRIFADESGKMNRSIKQIDGEILVVPQFTLFAELKGQNRPYFGNAAPPHKAKILFDIFVEQLQETGVKNVASGTFGAHMLIELVNDGPVTIIVDGSMV